MFRRLSNWWWMKRQIGRCIICYTNTLDLSVYFLGYLYKPLNVDRIEFKTKSCFGTCLKCENNLYLEFFCLKTYFSSSSVKYVDLRNLAISKLPIPLPELETRTELQITLD